MSEKKNNNKECNIIKDLLPLYFDGVCSEESKKIVEEHIKNCEQCAKELEIIAEYEETRKKQNKKDKDAFKAFSQKVRRKITKRFAINLLIALIVILLGYYFVFVNEFNMKYSDNLVTVKIPEDKGIDIYINAENYRKAYTVFENIGNNQYNIYVTVVNNIITKLTSDNDKSNNLVRIGNNLCVDFQSNSLRYNLPENAQIEKIYYYDGDSKKLDLMDSKDLKDASKNAVLIWEKG